MNYEQDLVWLVGMDKPQAAEVERVGAGLQIVRATLSEGVYVVQRTVGRGSYLSPFRVKSSTPGLTVAEGEYEEGRPEYAAARDALLVWCEGADGPQRAECDKAVPILRAPMSPDEECRGEWDADRRGSGIGHFRTSRCADMATAVWQYRINGWYVYGVKVEEKRRPAAAVPPASGDPATARQRAIEDIRRQHAERERLVAEPDRSAAEE